MTRSPSTALPSASSPRTPTFHDNLWRGPGPAGEAGRGDRRAPHRHPHPARFRPRPQHPRPHSQRRQARLRRGGRRIPRGHSTPARLAPHFTTTSASPFSSRESWMRRSPNTASPAGSSLISPTPTWASAKSLSSRGSGTTRSPNTAPPASSSPTRRCPQWRRPGHRQETRLQRFRAERGARARSPGGCASPQGPQLPGHAGPGRVPRRTLGRVDRRRRAVDRPDEGRGRLQRFVLAMALWQKGDKDRSRSFFEQAVSWTKKNDPKNAALLAFWREAAKLLGQPGPPAP